MTALTEYVLTTGNQQKIKVDPAILKVAAERILQIAKNEVQEEQKRGSASKLLRTLSTMGAYSPERALETARGDVADCEKLYAVIAEKLNPPPSST